MQLGEKIKQARLEAGLSQRQLCGEVITRNMLSLIENGSARPSMDTLAYFARQLGKPVSFFLEEDTVTSPNQDIMTRARKAWAERNAAEALKLFHYDNRESLLAFYNAFSLYIKRKLRQCAESDRAFYSTLVQKWDEAAQPMQANVNVKFWNTNLPRICLNAGRDATRRKDRI